MKKAFIFILLVCGPFFIHAKNHAFLLSSEKIYHENQDSLKDLHSFVFFPVLFMEEKNMNKILDLINQELNKVAYVVKKNVITPDGMNLEPFSNPTLQFTIEQLVDQNNKPLPTLQAILSVSSLVELSKSKQLTSITTNRWCMYLEKTNNVQKAIKETLPHLLKQFIVDFQRANIAEQKPTFYITYDNFWLKNQTQ